MTGNHRRTPLSNPRPAGLTRRRVRPSVECLETRALMASTGVTGGGQPFDNTQPSLALHYIINVNGRYPSREGDGSETQPLIGEIDLIAGNVAPRGWEFCNGQTTKINQHTALFSVLGFKYGGNGATTFDLPDLRDRAVIGAGQGENLPDHPFAQHHGKDFVALSEREIPRHRHRRADHGVTGEAGGGQPFHHSQPSLALHYMISPVGQAAFAQIRLFAGDYPPNGHLFCNGQILQIAHHERLFKLLGNAFGGNGKTTFALPDLRGRLDVGTGQVSGASLRTMGEQTGHETTTLHESQLPAHTHSVNDGVTGATGEGRSFDNTQPSLAISYMIATWGSYPLGDTFDDDAGGIQPFLGQIRAFPSNEVPNGWTPADGRLLSISANIALYTILGTTYGGDGVTTFALPNLSGRVPVGAGAGQTNRALGSAFGDSTVTLTVAQLPPHSHEIG